jgi:hypothetical protein
VGKTHTRQSFLQKVPVARTTKKKKKEEKKSHQQKEIKQN